MASSNAAHPALTRKITMLERDAAFYSWLWATGRRGGETLVVRWEDIVTRASGTSVLDAWAASNAVESLMITLDCTKTEHRTRPRTLYMHPSEGNPEHCGVRRLRRYQSWLDEVGHPCTGAVFPNMAKAQGERTPLSIQAMENRLSSTMRQHNLYGGETVHGFRRGLMQDLEDAGWAHADILQHVGILTPEVGERYLDRGRHLSSSTKEQERCKLQRKHPNRSSKRRQERLKPNSKKR